MIRSLVHFSCLAVAVFVMLMTCSCRKEDPIRKGGAKRIVANVEVVETKALSDNSAPGPLLSTRVVASAGGFDLVEYVYENETLDSRRWQGIAGQARNDGRDARNDGGARNDGKVRAGMAGNESAMTMARHPELDSGSQAEYGPNHAMTKGTVVTTEDIDTFGMLAYAEGEWYDHTIKDGDPGSKTNKNAAGLYFEASVAKRGSTWGLAKTAGPAREGTGDEAGNLYWVNNVPLTFWSYNIEKPSRTDTHTASFSYTVKSNVSEQKDLIYAFSKENRAFFDQGEDDYGEMDTGNCSSTSGASGEYVNIYFYHALSAVQFIKNQSLLDSDYRISKIEIQNVDSQTSCVMTSTDGTPAPGSPNIAFAHTSSTPANFSQEYGVDDSSLDIPSASSKFKPGDTKTFIMIPQERTNSKLKVTFKNTTTTNQEETSPLFDFNGTWDAGKYYVYKLDLKGAITVDISETCNNTSKSNVKFQNTSSLNEFIRAAIVANWYDSEGNIVAAWDKTRDGDITLGSGWTLGSDGFYYHTASVATKGYTSNLFNSFTKPTTAPVTGAHFEMTILVQAVCSDGYSSCAAAF